MYAFVRARQHEGTFPGEASTGVWPITALRILRGWGSPPESAWPYDGATWPPVEPLNIDALAKKVNLDYRRVRSLADVLETLAFGGPLLASFRITEAWYDAPNGVIPFYDAANSEAAHAVALTGYDTNKRILKFANSWGTTWGDQGFGTMSFETFEEAVCEVWYGCLSVSRAKSSKQRTPRKISFGWFEPNISQNLNHVCKLISGIDDMVGWGQALETPRFIEVEELFIMPHWRQAGHGRVLMQHFVTLARKESKGLRFWISFADDEPPNLARIKRYTNNLGLVMKDSPERWASHVVCADADDLSGEN